jgi:hypothetical protein
LNHKKPIWQPSCTTAVVQAEEPAEKTQNSKFLYFETALLEVKQLTGYSQP